MGDVRSTLMRHSKIDDVTAHKLFDQFASDLGRGGGDEVHGQG